RDVADRAHHLKPAPRDRNLVHDLVLRSRDVDGEPATDGGKRDDGSGEEGTDFHGICAIFAGAGMRGHQYRWCKLIQSLQWGVSHRRLAARLGDAARSRRRTSRSEEMKIVIIGGTGLIGSKLAPLLRSRGHEVLQASPSRGVNAVTGEGLQAALAGADIVVDVSNSPSFEDKAVLHFFETGTRNLTAAAKQASVRHLVALSVVGTDRLESSGYFRAKLAQERLIAT